MSHRAGDQGSGLSTVPDVPAALGARVTRAPRDSFFSVVFGSVSYL